MYRLLWLFLILLLAGCKTVPVALQRPAQVDASFAFNGRVAIRQGEQRQSTGVRWEHHAGSDDILLLAPLGQTVAHIHRDEEQAVLEASGKRYEAADMESLMQQALGWQLPLSGLEFWVKAEPAPGVESGTERDESGRLSVLHQQGWMIAYTKYAAETANALPLRLKLQRDDMEVLLLIDEWEAQP